MERGRESGVMLRFGIGLLLVSMTTEAAVIVLFPLVFSHSLLFSLSLHTLSLYNTPAKLIKILPQ